MGFRLVEKQEEEKKTYKGQTGLLDFIKEKKRYVEELPNQIFVCFYCFPMFVFYLNHHFSIWGLVFVNENGLKIRFLVHGVDKDWIFLLWDVHLFVVLCTSTLFGVLLSHFCFTDMNLKKLGFFLFELLLANKYWN